MSKADVLAKLVSTGGPLANGAITVSDISGLQTTLDGKLALSGGTLTGNLTFNGTQTWPTFNQNTTGNAATATTANNVSGGTISTTSVINSGNLAFTGTGNRITGDFSNATVANRVTFQSSTTNGNTAVGVIPNGTAIRSDLILYNSPDTTNNSFLDIFCSDTQYAFSGNKAGAGTYLPMTFYTGGSERLRIDTTGNMGLNVAPYPWLGGTKVIDVGNSFAVVGQGSQAALYANSYLNQNADGVYKNNGFAANYSMQSGRHEWGIAPSGTAGGIFNFTTAMLLNNSGNLGIGTSSPTERLHVNGNVLIAGSARRITGDFSNATIANRVGFQTSTTNGATDIPVIPNGTSTNARHFYYSTNDTANASLLTAGVVGPEATFRASAVGTGTSPPMTFYTAASERMRIDTSGNVGIGTSSPAAKLDVSGSGQTRLRITSTGTSLYPGLEIKSGSAIPFEVSQLSNGDGFIYNGANAIIGFSTNATERMRIDSAGNLGIGTTSPATRLELSKVYVGAGPTWAGGDDLLKLTAASGSAWAEPAIAFHEIGSNIGAKIGVKNTGNGAMNIIFANRNGSSLTSTMTERMRITVDGQVGLTSFDTSTFVGQQSTDIMSMWRTALNQGYYTDASDGGAVSYTFVGNSVIVDNSVGSHNWDIGKIYLVPGSYQIVFCYRPTATQHAWNVYGTNSNGHSISLVNDAAYPWSVYMTASINGISKDLSYSRTVRSGVYTVTTAGTYRIAMATDPYSGGGYKYYVESARLIKVS
jgi:hypothetical protein